MPSRRPRPGRRGPPRRSGRPGEPRARRSRRRSAKARRVDAHAHPHRPSGKRALGVCSCRDGVSRAREHHRERVALRPHLEAAVAADGLPDPTVMPNDVRPGTSRPSCRSSWASGAWRRTGPQRVPAVVAVDIAAVEPRERRVADDVAAADRASAGVRVLVHGREVTRRRTALGLVLVARVRVATLPAAPAVVRAAAASGRRCEVDLLELRSVRRRRSQRSPSTRSNEKRHGLRSPYA